MTFKIGINAGGLTAADVQNTIDANVGWARYADTQYTEASPFTVASGVTASLPNNAGQTITSQLPTGVTAFYDSATGKIIPDTELDKMVFTYRFKAKTSSASNASLSFGIDIGGTFGIIFPDSRLFIKGANTEQPFNFVMPGYTGSTFLANGGTPKITSIGGTTSIYDIELQVERTQKGR